MAPMRVRLAAALAGVVLSTSIAPAQQTGASGTAVKAAPQSASTKVQRAVREIQSLINGVAVNSDQTPVPNATIRLRNLNANAIEQVVTANELGQFTFVAVPEVPYVVEITHQDGRTVAVGDVILARAGEVAGAKLTVPSRLPALAGIYGGTASSVVSAAIGTGLQIVDPALPKLSPKQ
jgi:hypothetical protein